jgi:hypothetical protein
MLSPGASVMDDECRRNPKARVMEPFLSPQTKEGTGWKDRLKKRCLDRIARERERIIQQIRGIGPLDEPPATGKKGYGPWRPGDLLQNSPIGLGFPLRSGPTPDTPGLALRPECASPNAM